MIGKNLVILCLLSLLVFVLPGVRDITVCSMRLGIQVDDKFFSFVQKFKSSTRAKIVLQTCPCMQKNPHNNHKKVNQSNSCDRSQTMTHKNFEYKLYKKNCS